MDLWVSYIFNDMQKISIIIDAMNDLLDLKGIPRTTDFLEATLDLIDRSKGDFKSFIKTLLETSFWMSQDFPGNPFKNLCVELAVEIDQFAMKHSEPAYHSRSHFKDVCLMISYLLLQQQMWPEMKSVNNPWYVSREEGWALLYASIAHDFAHPGLINKTPYEIEQNSLDLLRQYLSSSSFEKTLYEPLLDMIRPWILATDHAAYKDLCERVSLGSPGHSDCLSILLVEADLIASILPNRGRELTYRLSREWGVLYPKEAIALRNEVGYLSFLNSLNFLSPHALAAQIPQILNHSVLQMRSRL